MDSHATRRGDAALRHLCLGKQIVGVRWSADTFCIAIEQVVPSAGTAVGDLLLTGASRWTVFPSQPERVPRGAEDLPALSLEETVVALARLASQDSVAAALGDAHAHRVRRAACSSSTAIMIWTRLDSGSW